MDRSEEIKQIPDSANNYHPPAEFLEELKRKLQPASFIIRKPKVAKSSELIIDLIIKSVTEQSAITRDDIYRLYWLYKTDNETNQLPNSREWVFKDGWVDISFDRETFIKHWRMQRNAISWFKAALSSAILDGKLLVLPIIQL